MERAILELHDQMGNCFQSPQLNVSLQPEEWGFKFFLNENLLNLPVDFLTGVQTYLNPSYLLATTIPHETEFHRLVNSCINTFPFMLLKSYPFCFFFNINYTNIRNRKWNFDLLISIKLYYPDAEISPLQPRIIKNVFWESRKPRDIWGGIGWNLMYFQEK